MDREYKLLKTLSQSNESIYDLSKVISVGDIAEAVSLGLAVRRHDNVCVLTERGKERLLVLEDARSSRELALNAIEECRRIANELEATRQELADYKAQQYEQHETDTAQMKLTEKKQIRHQYIVAAFTVALTLALEHIVDIADFFTVLVEKISTLFH